MDERATSAFFMDRRRGEPSPSASEINQQILNLVHDRGSLSATALAEITNEKIEHLTGRLNTLVRLGLLNNKKENDGTMNYFLSNTGMRAQGLAYLSIRRK